MRRPLPFKSDLALLASLSLGMLPAHAAITGAYSGKGTHAGFTISPVDAVGKISTMGLAWLKNGDMVLVRAPDSYMNPPGASANSGVWIVKNIATSPTITKLAGDFRQPTGVTVGPNDEIMVVDLDGVYKVSATDGKKDHIIPMPATKDGSLPYHGYIFCPMYHAATNMYYAPYSSTFVPGGFADTDPDGEYAGAVLSWKPDGAGGYGKYAGGLRSPNGGGLGPWGIMMYTDNQGSWNPSCALNIIKKNAFYGLHQNAPHTDNWAGQANKAGTMPYQPPIAWMLQAQATGTSGVGASSSQPFYMDHGPYNGDVLVGDVTLEGISRVALDPVGGTGEAANYNGSVHWFTNLPGGSNCAAPNRWAMDPKADVLYVGTLEIIGQGGGAWPSGATQPFYKISLDAAAIKSSFEILGVKSRANGVDVIFSQPVDASVAASNFVLKQWDLKRQEGYGAGNTSSSAPSVSSVKVCPDGKTVFLGIGNNAKFDRVLEITSGVKSSSGASLVYNKTLFTHNYQSTAEACTAPPPPPAVSTNIPDRSSNGYANNVIPTMLPGAVRLKVELQGAYTVSLSKLNGAVVETKQGFNAGEFVFKAPGQGLHIVEVRQGGRSYARPVTF